MMRCYKKKKINAVNKNKIWTLCFSLLWLCNQTKQFNLRLHYIRKSVCLFCFSPASVSNPHRGKTFIVLWQPFVSALSLAKICFPQSAPVWIRFPCSYPKIAASWSPSPEHTTAGRSVSMYSLQKQNKKKLKESLECQLLCRETKEESWSCLAAVKSPRCSASCKWEEDFPS